MDEMDVFSLVMRKGEEPWGPGTGIGLYGEAPPERGAFFRLQAPVVQRLDNAIRWINHYSVVGFVNTYPLDSDLSSR